MSPVVVNGESFIMVKLRFVQYRERRWGREWPDLFWAVEVGLKSSKRKRVSWSVSFRLQHGIVGSKLLGSVRRVARRARW